MKLLDLFCGAGGAGMGYYYAGFEVTGVDIEPQPNYPFDFVQSDATEYLARYGDQFDAIHASPPCQRFTSLRTMPTARIHPDFIIPTRDLLRRIAAPYVIENVVGAPLENPIMLCGTMFDLGYGDAELRRHRLFETNFPVDRMPCRHLAHSTIGVYGEGARDSRRKFDKGIPEFGIRGASEAMEIDWMTVREISQAIPPAYTEYIGGFLLRASRPATYRVATAPHAPC